MRPSVVGKMDVEHLDSRELVEHGSRGEAAVPEALSLARSVTCRQ